MNKNPNLGPRGGLGPAGIQSGVQRDRIRGTGAWPGFRNSFLRNVITNFMVEF